MDGDAIRLTRYAYQLQPVAVLVRSCPPDALTTYHHHTDIVKNIDLHRWE